MMLLIRSVMIRDLTDYVHLRRILKQLCVFGGSMFQAEGTASSEDPHSQNKVRGDSGSDGAHLKDFKAGETISFVFY